MLSVKEPEKTWGGPWTEIKLNAFEDYVQAYLKIMKKQKWKTIYFDGFAGSGSKKNKQSFDIGFLDITDEEESVYRGAAERVVRMVDPFTFDFYYFVEKSKTNLNKLKAKFEQIQGASGKKIEFRPGDCNQQLIKLSEALRNKKFSALVLLDPFGMQVNWQSICSLKETRSDIWLLLPTAIIINRLLDKKGKLKTIKRLEQFFGLSESEIRSHFYRQTGQQILFSDESEETKKVLDPINKIADLYISRMKSIWKYVTEPPLRLNNRKGAPLFHFVFASNKTNALKIANYIIRRR